MTGDRLPVAAFNLDGVPHGLLAARLANEYAIGTRSGCFCAHPYMGRLLGLTRGRGAASSTPTSAPACGTACPVPSASARTGRPT